MDGRLCLVEAAYRIELSDDEALRTLAETLSRTFETRAPVLCLRSEVQRDGTLRFRGLHTVRDDRAEAATAFETARLRATTLDHQRMFRSAPGRHSLTTLISPTLHEVASSKGVTDFVGLNCPVGNGAVVLGAVRDQPTKPSRSERAYWRPVAAHLSSAFRLRDALRSLPAAHLHADGRLAHAHTLDVVPALGRLRDAVRKREAVRIQRRSVAGRLWPAVVAGRWAIVDRFDADGRRFVVAYAVPPPATRLHALTQREQHVIEGGARGESNKAIAIELGVSEATVSRAMSSALRKLGGNLAETFITQEHPTVTMQVGSHMLVATSTPLTPATDPLLTTAERCVLALAVRGLSNSAIARARGRAVRTVVNQLHSGFEKLGVKSRRELVLRWHMQR